MLAATERLADDAVALALLGHEADPGPIAARGSARRQRLAIHLDACPRSGRSTPAIRRRSSVRPDADQARDAQHLAAAEVEAGVAARLAARQVARPRA